jgi:hypothetical protein
MEEVSCSDLFSEGQFLGLGLRLRFEQSYCELNRPETGGWRLEEYGWLPWIILKTSSSLRVFASPRELWLFESPDAKRTSSPLQLKVRAAYEKIACEAEKRSLRLLENITTSVHRPVQSVRWNRAQSKII